MPKFYFFPQFTSLNRNYFQLLSIDNLLKILLAFFQFNRIYFLCKYLHIFFLLLFPVFMCYNLSVFYTVLCLFNSYTNAAIFQYVFVLHILYEMSFKEGKKKKGKAGRMCVWKYFAILINMSPFIYYWNIKYIKHVNMATNSSVKVFLFVSEAWSNFMKSYSYLL